MNGGIYFWSAKKVQGVISRGCSWGTDSKVPLQSPGKHTHMHTKKNVITLYLPSHNGCQAAAPPELENLKIFHILKFSSAAQTCLLATFIEMNHGNYGG